MADEISNTLQSVPMEFLIGAPFAASIKAQKQLGLEMINLVNLLAYGDEKAAAGAEVKTLDMSLERPVTRGDGTVDTSTINGAPNDAAAFFVTILIVVLVWLC